MQRAVSTAYRQQEPAVLAALYTVYFMAKKNLPNDMFSDLKQFQVLLSDMYHFNFSRAFELWCSIKDRAISNV